MTLKEYQMFFTDPKTLAREQKLLVTDRLSADFTIWYDTSMHITYYIVSSSLCSQIRMPADFESFVKQENS